MAPKPKPKSKGQGVAARARKDRAFLKKALANPGLRSKLDPSQLPPEMRRKRELNVRLNAPIVQGSATTERDLAHAAGAATDVRYGPQERQLGQNLGISQQVERDTGSFYDQYQQALAQHASNVAAYQAGAQQALQQTQAGITGLAGAQGAQMQQAANQAAQQQGVAPAGNLMPDANAAAAVRQALAGSFGSEQALQGAAANTYASTQANVVAPGQKLSALAQARGRTQDVRQKLTDLQTEKGAFNEQFRDTRRQDEFKNVLAAQTLGLNAQKAAADAASSSPAAVAATAGARQEASSEAQNAQKYGYSVHQWRMLGPDRRRQIIDKAKKTGGSKASDTTYTTGAFAGKTKSEVAALSPQQRKQIVDEYNKNGGPKGRKVEASTQYRRDFRRKYGIDPLGTAAHNKARSNISAAQRALKLVGTKDSKGKTVTTDAIVAALSAKYDPVVVRAALDVARYGGVTNSTANRLHHAGYSVAALGLKPGKPKPAYKPPRPGTPAASVPGLGGN